MAKFSDRINSIVELLNPGKSVSIISTETAPELIRKGGLISLFGDESPQFAARTTPPPKIAEKEYIDQTLAQSTTVIDTGRGRNISAVLERKPGANELRSFARNSTWVRAAIDYCRRTAGRAQFELIPFDSTEKLSRRDKQVKQQIELLLAHPNEADSSYSEMKEMMLEDYYTLGHGALELDLARDLTVLGIRPLDAAKIGFVRDWDGTDPAFPRYCEFDEKNPARVKRYLAHQQVMCLVNRPMSYTRLGYSHVEALYKTVIALLSGDDHLINQILNPIAQKMIDLGENATAAQVETFKYEILQVKDALAVTGGGKGTKVHNLSGTAEEMKILDGATWFVRQVAAVFGISTAKLKLAVDTSRANTNAMMDDDIEAVTGELTRIEELETATFIKRESYLGDLNLKFFYPIMHRKDERQQAAIAKMQTNQPWASANEARTRTGEKALDPNDFPFADEVMVNTGKMYVPMSIYSRGMEQMQKLLETDPAEGLKLLIGAAAAPVPANSEPVASGDKKPAPQQ